MDRIWQWAWDRYGSRYSWALWAIVFQFLLLIYLVPSFVVVTFEKSDRYLEAAAVTAVGVLVLVLPAPGTPWWLPDRSPRPLRC